MYFYFQLLHLLFILLMHRELVHQESGKFFIFILSEEYSRIEYNNFEIDINQQKRKRFPKSKKNLFINIMMIIIIMIYIIENIARSNKKWKEKKNDGNFFFGGGEFNYFPKNFSTRSKIFFISFVWMKFLTKQKKNKKEIENFIHSIIVLSMI